MGYYTELQLEVILTKDAPLDIIEKLSNNAMWNELAFAKFGRTIGAFNVSETPNLPIEHPFDKSTRWDLIFNTSTTTFNKDIRALKIICDIKAYESIYEQLIDWLTPYILKGTIKTKGEDEEEYSTNFYLE